MSIVRINALTVPPDRARDLEERFAGRAGEIDHVDGFESFELLRPTAGIDQYLVVTRWRDEDAFDAWRQSRAFDRAHRGDGSPAAESAQLWSFDVVLRASKPAPS